MFSKVMTTCFFLTLGLFSIQAYSSQKCIQTVSSDKASDDLKKQLLSHPEQVVPLVFLVKSEEQSKFLTALSNFYLERGDQIMAADVKKAVSRPLGNSEKLVWWGGNKMVVEYACNQKGLHAIDLATSFKESIGINSNRPEIVSQRLWDLYLNGDKNATVRIVVRATGDVAEFEGGQIIDKYIKTKPGGEMQTIALVSIVLGKIYELGIKAQYLSIGFD